MSNEEINNGYVEVENGYMVLKSEKAKELFESYSTSGTLWEVISMLFNDYAENGSVKSTLDEINTKLPGLQELNALAKLSESLPVLEKVLSSVNMNRLEGVNHKEISNSIIEDKVEIKPVSVEIEEFHKPPKKKKGGMDSLVRKMKKFK